MPQYIRSIQTRITSHMLKPTYLRINPYLTVKLQGLLTLLRSQSGKFETTALLTEDRGIRVLIRELLNTHQQYALELEEYLETLGAFGGFVKNEVRRSKTEIVTLLQIDTFTDNRRATTDTIDECRILGKVLEATYINILNEPLSVELSVLLQQQLSGLRSVYAQLRQLI